MSAENMKLSLIERVLKENDPLILKEVEELLIQAAMQKRAKESMNDISNGDVLDLESFQQKNMEWVEKKFSK